MAVPSSDRLVDRPPRWRPNGASRLIGTRRRATGAAHGSAADGPRSVGSGALRLPLDAVYGRSGRLPDVDHSEVVVRDPTRTVDDEGRGDQAVGARELPI